MLEVCPVTLKEANAFVAEHHRHHKPVVGHKFSIGCTDGEKIVGVAIVGRPVSRYLDDGWTLEVNRLCTDGTRNACSILYAAAWRAVRAMGYRKLITNILDTEPGTSLRVEEMFISFIRRWMRLREQESCCLLYTSPSPRD